MTALPPDGPLTGRDVVILAGGLGTRIRAVLGDTPKLLAPVGSRRLLDLVALQLARRGADRIVLALGHGAEAVLAALPETIERLRRQPGVRADLTITGAVEPAPLGTAGAVRHVRPLLRPGPALVMNGDTLSDADPGGLVERMRASDADGAVMCVAVPDTDRFGRIELTGDGRRIARFREKEPGAGPGLINAGTYLFTPALLDRIAESAAASLEHDIFRPMPPGRLEAVTVTGRFVDVGTPEGFAEAALLFGA